MADNCQLLEDPGFVDAARGNFALKPDAASRFNLAPIPFDEIGLYPDAHRRSLPTAAIQAARAQHR